VIDWSAVAGIAAIACLMLACLVAGIKKGA
jgi:hypothetical protein